MRREAFLNIAGVIIRLKSKHSLNISKKSYLAKFFLTKRPCKLDMDLTLEILPRFREFNPKIVFETKRNVQEASERASVVIPCESGRGLYIGQDTDWRVGESNERIIFEGGSSTNYQALLGKDLKEGKCFIIDPDKKTEALNMTHEFLKILFLYYLTKNRLGIMAHGAGIKYGDDGYLFAGPHASGKSTITRIWDRYAGAGIASDECIVIKRRSGGLYMHNTPWHGEFRDFRNSADRIKLKKVFFIYHRKDNKAEKITARSRFNLFFQSVFLSFWDKDCVDFVSQSISDIVTATLCYKLGFKKDDSSVINYVRTLE